jgi:excisionase family DNA binding protein
MNEANDPKYELDHDHGNRLFISASDVGRQLGLRKSRVYELAAAGLLPSVRLGRRIWFPVRGLDALAETAIEEARTRLKSEVDRPNPFW